MFRVPSQKMIDDYLINQQGLTKENRYFYGNEYLAITDVSNVSDNVLCDEDGKLYFIDPIIRLKKSEERYGSIFIEQDVYDSYNCKKQKSHPGSLFYGKRGGNCCCKFRHYSSSGTPRRSNLGFQLALFEF